VLEGAVQHDASLARVRHLLAMHASVGVGGPVTAEQREVAQMTRTTVRTMLDQAESSRVVPLVRRRRSRVAFVAGLLAAGLAGVRGYLEQCHAEAMIIFGGLSDADLLAPCQNPSGAEMATWKWLRAMAEHEAHHRGQLYLMASLRGRSVARR